MVLTRKKYLVPEDEEEAFTGTWLQRPVSVQEGRMLQRPSHEGVVVTSDGGRGLPW